VPVPPIGGRSEISIARNAGNPAPLVGLAKNKCEDCPMGLNVTCGYVVGVVTEEVNSGANDPMEKLLTVPLPGALFEMPK